MVVEQQQAAAPEEQVRVQEAALAPQQAAEPEAPEAVPVAASLK